MRPFVQYILRCRRGRGPWVRTFMLRAMIAASPCRRDMYRANPVPRSAPDVSAGTTRSENEWCRCCLKLRGIFQEQLKSEAGRHEQRELRKPELKQTECEKHQRCNMASDLRMAAHAENKGETADETPRQATGTDSHRHKSTHRARPCS